MVDEDTEVMRLKNEEKTKVTYTKDMLVKMIANECGENISSVKNVYNALEHDIANLLSSADINTDISIRLFEGIVLNSEFVPEKAKVNNLTGETITTTSKIKPTAHITRCYREKITDYSK